MCKCIELCSAVNTGGKDSRFIKPHEYDTISCPDECDSLKYTTQVIAAEIVLKSQLTTKNMDICKDLKNVFRSRMLLLKTTVTSSMKVCFGRETKQILQSALHSLRNTRSSSRFDLASLQQITNPSSRKLSKKFRNLIGTEKYWGLQNLAGSQCRSSKVNGTYKHTAPQVHRLCGADGKKQDQEDDFPPRLLWQSWGD